MLFVFRQQIRCVEEELRRHNGSLMFLHGGGWIISSPLMYDTLLLKLVQRVGITVVSVELVGVTVHTTNTVPK